MSNAYKIVKSSIDRWAVLVELRLVSTGSWVRIPEVALFFFFFFFSKII